MDSKTLWSPIAASILLSASITRAVSAQYIGPGSTAPGDYLRGVGIAAAGLGTYNLDTARANAIDTDTAIKWNDYVATILEYERKKYADRRARMIAATHENYRKEQERISRNASEFDVRNGNAINSVLNELLDPKYSRSAYQYASVPIPIDLVRKIPSKLGEKGVTFSMSRLSPKGNGKWTIAFQDDRCRAERLMYQQALDAALEQAVHGKMLDGSIERVEAAVKALYNRLEDGAIPRNDTRYFEGKEQLRELQAVVEDLKFKKVQMAIGEIEKYSGATVFDLKVLMQRHGLRFGEAKTPEEKQHYPELYTLLRQQRDALDGASAPVK